MIRVWDKLGKMFPGVCKSLSLSVVENNRETGEIKLAVAVVDLDTAQVLYELMPPEDPLILRNWDEASITINLDAECEDVEED